MGSGRVVIHFCARGLSVLEAILVNLFGIRQRVNTHFCDILNLNHTFWVIDDFEILVHFSVVLRLQRVKTVIQVVAVELNHIALELNFELVVFLQFLLNLIQLRNGSRHYAWVVVLSLDGEGLTAASLPIGKDAHVVAINDTLHQHLSVLEHFRLCGLAGKHSVISELFLIIATLTALRFNFQLQRELIHNCD